MTDAERPGALRRIAAVLAILGLVGALAAVFSLFVRGDAWRLLVAILSIAVAVVGLWYAVTRRAAPRLVGTILAPRWSWRLPPPLVTRSVETRAPSARLPCRASRHPDRIIPSCS